MQDALAPPHLVSEILVVLLAQTFHDADIEWGLANRHLCSLLHLLGTAVNGYEKIVLTAFHLQFHRNIGADDDRADIQ